EMVSVQLNFGSEFSFDLTFLSPYKSRDHVPVCRPVITWCECQEPIPKIDLDVAGWLMHC
ncbi:MAG: hypothetical protein K5905_06480, partial [Roseibium sp.]|uniref:hypothetical protein n=1 Tax=Roseibium sp. TaxID=1936156 RepID=UPI002639FB08